MAATDLLTGLAIAIGLVGIVVPVLPGSVLVLAAILLWAVLTSTAIGWTTFAVATLLLAAGSRPTESPTAASSPARCSAWSASSSYPWWDS